MTTFTIGEVAQRVGLNASALRYYEEIGLLAEPQRVSGRRVYGKQLFQQLAAIQLAKQAGFTLHEIGLLMGENEEVKGYSGRWQALAQSKIEELDALIANAQQMKGRLQEGLSCHCQALADCEPILRKTNQFLEK